MLYSADDRLQRSLGCPREARDYSKLAEFRVHKSPLSTHAEQTVGWVLRRKSYRYCNYSRYRYDGIEPHNLSVQAQDK